MNQVNLLNYEEFINRFGNVIEHCPISAAAIWKNRPFQNIYDLHENICKFVDQLPDIGDLSFNPFFFGNANLLAKLLLCEGKEGILRLHPDLAGKLAEIGDLTGESAAEQKAAGLDLMTPEEKVTLKGANAR